MRYSSKSFSLDSLRGKEIVETLNEKFKQFKPQGVPVLEVVALVNDAVSSLAGFKFLHESCDLAFRINVGVNGSYFEYSRVIDYLKRCDYRIEELTERMAINLELGGYGNPKFSSDYSFLKKFEIKYDDMSNPQKDGNR
ncbi:MAG: putative hexokinase hkdc1 [Paramarteilia canceri]